MSRRLSFPGRAVTLAEVIFAIGILAIYAVGILSAVGTAQSFDLREKFTADAYRYGEEQIESLVHLADDPDTFDEVSEATLLAGGFTDIGGVPTRFASYVDPATGADVEDRRYFVEVQVADLSADLKRIDVVVRKQHPSESVVDPTPDPDLPRDAELLRLSTFRMRLAR